jgi:small subunit ribosomal protein S4
MISGPKYKICRRLGTGIYEKCQGQKFATSEANRGEKVRKHPRTLTDYGMQLLNKQRVRYTYGISEKQFAAYVKKAGAEKGSSPASKLLELLESRLDSVVYRLGFAPTRAASRQMVSHGHITVNGRKVTIPSYALRAADIVGIRDGSKKKTLFAELDKSLKGYQPPSWMKFNADTKEAKVEGKPTLENSGLFFDLNSVIDFYSR